MNYALLRTMLPRLWKQAQPWRTVDLVAVRLR